MSSKTGSLPGRLQPVYQGWDQIHFVFLKQLSLYLCLTITEVTFYEYNYYLMYFIKIQIKHFVYILYFFSVNSNISAPCFSVQLHHPSQTSNDEGSL